MTNSNSQHNGLNNILHTISFYPEKRVETFLSLLPQTRATVLIRLTKHILYSLLNQISDEVLIDTLEHLDPDEATDIIQSLPKHRQKNILEHLSEELRNSVAILTEFDPQTAAGLMNVDYIQVDASDSIFNVAKRFKAHEKRTGRLPTIIVMEEGKIKGYLPGHELSFAKPHEHILKYVRRIPTVKHNVDHDHVIKIFKDHPHNKIAVLGEHENVVGVIYSDDILRVFEDQESASLYDFAGVHEEETVSDSAKTKIKFRYKWLIVNLATAFLAAFTVGLFNDTISKYVLLAIYMPIVAGMGGNAGTQTLAVLVRGISLKQIDLKTSLLTLKHELVAAFFNGLINGAIVAVVVVVFNHNVKVAIILAIAMIVNLVVAGFFGTLVPLIMKSLGKDPATSATVFITTATDVLGFLVFLGLATLMLQ
ncbi:magnesium transporter [Candidatus Woesebacteria bacterium]|nr:magnesium transporter [Candidatus Woesebacteria bacterium]